MIDVSCESIYALYRDVHIYLESVIQDIEALGHSWRLKIPDVSLGQILEHSAKLTVPLLPPMMIFGGRIH